ncbi:MAG: prolyl oligopeptidase family serine peptidase [Planctomycetes bacterium]|nr:prolyl oligopeptidase family serine peptidase [Planctomycetota bacterium]
MKSLCLFQWWSQTATVWFGDVRITATPAPAAFDAQASIAASHAPPADFRDQPGSFRSPLMRDDGTRVADASQWPARRAEILGFWHGEMGAWPALIDAPRVDLVSEEQRDGYALRTVRVQVAAERTLTAYLLVPSGTTGRRPAVLTVYYDAETGAGMKPPSRSTYALDLAKRGFVTLSIGVQPWTVDDHAFYPDGIQPLSYLAYVAANCCNALAAMPEVDPARIGVTGHSYGGKWAMFASCLYERFACAAWSDGGIVFDEERGNVNYWEPWYLGWQPGTQRARGEMTDPATRTGAYARMIAAKHDLHELHALMAPRPFLVSGGSEDPPSRWIALNHARAVNALLGVSDRVAMTNRPEHGHTDESKAQLVEFFVRELKP